MLDHEENLGYARIIVSAVFSLISLLSLLLFGISPRVCGIGFIFAGIVGFMGECKLLNFFPVENYVDRILDIILKLLLNILCIPPIIFGIVLFYDLI